MSMRYQAIGCIAILSLLAGCTSDSIFESVAPGTKMSLRDHGTFPLPAELTIGSKSTGQYEFKVMAATGETLYGILPLRVNGGTMAASIVLFAPAFAIGGFRDALPVYEVDAKAGILRYKVRPDGAWQEMRPMSNESARAKAYFDSLAEKCAKNPDSGNCGTK